MLIPWHLEKAPGQSLQQLEVGGRPLKFTDNWSGREHTSFTIVNQIVLLPRYHKAKHLNALGIRFCKDPRDPSLSAVSSPASWHVASVSFFRCKSLRCLRLLLPGASALLTLLPRCYPLSPLCYPIYFLSDSQHSM